MLGSDIGIDLGTANTLVYVRGKGVVLSEPAVVAYDKDTNEIKAIGEEAHLMIGRAPGNIAAIRPLRQGVIADYTVTEKMLNYFIHKAVGRKTLRRPRICVCVPSGVTEVEKRAVIEATMNAGARDVEIVEEPIAAALGAGIDISKPSGNMIVDIGGGTTDIAVISMCDAVVSESIKVAGKDFDEALIRYMRRKYNVLIGERTAEEVKINVGCVYTGIDTVAMDVRGRDLITGMPKTVKFSSDEAVQAFQEPVTAILDGIRHALELTPPELAADIAEKGIILSGGGSQIRGLEELIEETTGISTTTVDDPMSVVAIGTGRYTKFMQSMQELENRNN
ncbi:MAG: rod shape-determining protein [Lachnospiraceae bacterium]|nr:rod shape-determining protein [Lachnospiraceae bacterium]